MDSILHAWRHFGQKHKNNKINNGDIIIMELYRLPRQWRLLEMKIEKLENMLRHLIFKTIQFLDPPRVLDLVFGTESDCAGAS